jgi:uracil-DNA glycosylase
VRCLLEYTLRRPANKRTIRATGSQAEKNCGEAQREGRRSSTQFVRRRRQIGRHPCDRFSESAGELPGTEFDKPYFAKLRQFIVDERKAFEVLPPAADVFNAFRSTPLEDVRVVILGQDPYPTPGHAHGLCFSVRPKVGIPASLRNMYRELHDDLGIPPASHGYLESWATQGVLLLNPVLTVRAKVRDSHKGKGWEEFTDAVVAAVNALPRRVVFVLWGNGAKKKAAGVDEKKHTVIRGVHPSPMSAETGFFGSKPFSKVNAALEASGQAPIDWRLPTSVG